MDENDTGLTEADLAACLQTLYAPSRQGTAVRHAHSRIVEAYTDSLVLLLYRQGLQWHDALELVQVVLLDLWQRPGIFDPSRARPGELHRLFWSWLTTAARNRRCSLFRTLSRRQRHLAALKDRRSPVGPPTPEEEALQTEKTARARQLICSFAETLLQDWERVTLDLLIAEGPDFDLTLLMERCQVSRPTASRRRRHVLEKLKDFMTAWP